MTPARHRSFRALVAPATLLLCVGMARADTLLLRDGRRVEGTLVGVRGDSIDFEKGGWSRTVQQFDRADVQSIEINDSGRDRGESRRDDDRDAEGPPTRPRGLRERSISVAANSPWTDTGIELRRGQEIYFASTGQVRWGKDRRDDAGGEHNSPRNPARPIPDRPGAALIGRVDNDDPFFIGNDPSPIRVRSGGQLRLGINDDYLLDNAGAFRVTVYY